MMVQPRLTQSQDGEIRTCIHCGYQEMCRVASRWEGLKSEHFDAQGMPTKEAASAT